MVACQPVSDATESLRGITLVRKIGFMRSGGRENPRLTSRGSSTTDGRSEGGRERHELTHFTEQHGVKNVSMRLSERAHVRRPTLKDAGKPTIARLGREVKKAVSGWSVSHASTGAERAV